jgi:hypothetical protein
VDPGSFFLSRDIKVEHINHSAEMRDQSLYALRIRGRRVTRTFKMKQVFHLRSPMTGFGTTCLMDRRLDQMIATGVPDRGPTGTFNRDRLDRGARGPRLFGYDSLLVTS